MIDFKLIVGSEDIYATSLGQIGRFYDGVFRPLKPRINNIGYGRVRVFVDNKWREKLVHRLVAEVFVPNKNNYPIVNHKDGNKTNNLHTNLEWCTQKQNMQHAFKNGLVTGGGRPKKKS